ncbi:ATP-dependent DNA helicase [Georgenia faecalis]|uniref:DNA 5'-3' helicase n=1 Tax=Georgenia faecalis TaxID=2483799 RepID=A0ABV9DEQ4_9MICO
MSGPDRTTALLDAAVARIGGARRPGQEAMARAISEVLAEPAPLLVQAGTGTGKSLAYLVPVLAHAVEKGQRAVISTATLALQRQVLVHDVPLVADVVAERTGLRPQAAVLKGWQNYVCKHKLGGGYPADDEPGLFPADATTPDPQRTARAASTLGEQILRVREWAEETDTGDRDDLVPGVSERAWRQVSVSKLECLGTACPMLAECFPEAARQAAREADVVITNHAMLGIAAAGSPNVLPEHDVLVVDEAHELAERVTAQSTLELSATVVERTARLARRHGALGVDLEQAATVLRTRLETVPDGRLRDGLPAGLADAVTLVDAAAREALTALRGTGEAEAGGRLMARAAVLTLTEVTERLLSDRIAQRRDVLWCERGRTGLDAPRLHLAPLDVSAPIADHLLSGRAAVLTSATLALGGTFDAMARTLGATLLGRERGDDRTPDVPGAGRPTRPAPAAAAPASASASADGADADDGRPWRALDVGSPFDYRRQGILYIARHLPPPGRDGTSAQALEEVLGLVRAAGGATLGLFSSRRAAEEAADLLRSELDVPVLCQGDDQLPTLVRRFAEDEATCLMGTLSLWQGVDVPGPTCRLVLIDRIPFPRPDDPVRSARSEAAAAAGGNGFMAVAASHAALLLAQGAGRLVRTMSDRGVVAVLDPRLATARYGTFLTRSMPPMWQTTDGTLARDALRRLATGTSRPAGRTATA